MWWMLVNKQFLSVDDKRIGKSKEIEASVINIHITAKIISFYDKNGFLKYQ